MSLVRKTQINVSGFKSSPSKALTFYQGDVIRLEITIGEINLNLRTGRSERVTYSPLRAKMLIDTPTEEDMVESVNIDGDIITFDLDKTHTKNVGITKCMVILLDDDGCEVTIPEFTFEVKERLNVLETKAVVDESPIGYSTISEGAISVGEEWVKGEIISSTKLNSIANEVKKVPQLEEKQTELSSALETKANNDVVRMKNTKITENDISDTLKAQITGTTAIGTIVKDKSIDWVKADFMTSENLFNKHSLINDKYINKDNGNMSANASYNCTDFIRIEPQTTYFHNAPSNGNEAFYDENKVYIGQTNPTSISSVSVINSGNAYYIRLSCAKSGDVSKTMLSKTNPNDVIDKYIPFQPQLKKEYTQAIKYDDIPTHFSKVKELEKLGIIKTDNLVDKTKLTSGYLDKKGIITPHATYCTTDYIYLKANTDYYMIGGVYSSTNAGQLFDFDGNFIGYKQAGNKVVIRVEIDCLYRFTIMNSSSDIGLYEGNINKGITEYGYYIPKDFVKGDTSIEFDDLGFVSSVNLFNKDDKEVVLDKFLDGTFWGDNTSYFTSGYIKVKKDITYSIGYCRFLNYFDNYKVFVSKATPNSSNYKFTPTQDGYIRFTSQKPRLNSEMLNVGSVQLDYEPYKLVIPSEYLGVSNGADGLEICLPNTMYIGKGRTLEIYYEQILPTQNIDEYKFVTTCKNASGNAIGINYPNKFSMPTTDSTTTGDYTLQIEVYSNMKLVLTKSITVKVASRMNVGTHTTIPFGDSLVNKPWLKETRDLMSGTLNFVGTIDYALSHTATSEERKYLKNEGRPGWTQSYYLAEGAKFTQLKFKVNSVIVLPAPKKVYYLPSGGVQNAMQYEFEEAYDINGNVTTVPSQVSYMKFNQFVNSWSKPDGQTTGGTMTGVNSGVTGDASIVYTSYTTTESNPFWNPNTQTVDFSYYFMQNSISEPNSFCMLLGMNDINDSESIIALVDKIQTQMPNKKVFVMLPHYRGEFYYNPKIKKAFYNFAKNVISGLSLNSNAIIVPLYACHDSRHNMGWKVENVNPRNSNYTIKIAEDNVHPQECGYFQFADILYSAYVNNI